MSHLQYFNGKLGKLCGWLTSRLPWKPSVWLLWSFGVQPYFLPNLFPLTQAPSIPVGITSLLYYEHQAHPCLHLVGSHLGPLSSTVCSLRYSLSLPWMLSWVVSPSFSEFMWHVVSESPPFNPDSIFCLVCLFNSWLSYLLPELVWNSLRAEMKSLSLCPLSIPWSSETPSSGTRLWDQASLHFSQIWFNYL